MAQHPMEQFGIKTPEQYQAEIQKLKEVANFWKNHWAAVYVALAFGLWRAYQAAKVNRAVIKIASRIPEKNPSRRRRKR